MTVSLSINRPMRVDSEYGSLLTQVQGAHLLHRSGFAYLPRGLVVGGGMAVGVAVFLLLGQSWWQLVVAAYLAVVFAQVGFLGHDAGHQQIFRTKRLNDNVGMVLSNLGVGLSYGWWVDKHNRHHRHPNRLGSDPDVARNVLAWTGSQADLQRGPLRFVAKYQAAFFFPLLFLEAWNLHVGSARKLIAQPRKRLVESLLLCAHVVGWLALLLVFLSPLQALAFVVVQQSLFGFYLGCSFAPNHKGMRVVNPDAAPIDFLRRQVLTSRNVRGGRVITAVFGGLNYQIEHHLFPSMPSRNLRRCRPLVKDFCAQRGVAYCEVTMLASYAAALRALHNVRPGRARIS